jgi:ACR3 family arsenite efflux pump ArsB
MDMTNDGLSFADLMRQYLNFAEFPVLKLICALVLAWGTWRVLREVFDTLLAQVPLWIKALYFIVATAVWYLMMTLLLGYSETTHDLFIRVSRAMKLAVDGILQITGGKP